MDPLPINLPTYEEARMAVERGDATALQRFIYDNEPADRKEEEAFRDGLARVVLEAEGSL